VQYWPRRLSYPTGVCGSMTTRRMIVEKAKVKKNDTMESLRQHSKLWQAGTVRLIEGRIIKSRRPEV